MLQQQDTPVQIQHAHTDDHYAMIFSRPVDRIFMTPAQAEQFIEAVRGVLGKLAEHKAKPSVPPLAMAANDAPTETPGV